MQLKMQFPENFIWGAASASYQIEGGAFEDGKGLSIWDVFTHEPGRIADGKNGDVACDSYHRLEEDLDILKELGIPNYRFSVSWPRVLPDGTGRINDAGAAAVNEAGLAYYDRVVDGCLARGIEPWLTLYHWDLPQALQERGGWQSRKTVDAFAEYTRVIAEHFRGRVRHYITINEPQIIVGMGYGTGLHAPGLKLSEDELFTCWHHLMLAHGCAVQILRAACPDVKIGVSSTGTLGYIEEHPAETPKELSDFSFHAAEASIPGFNSWFNHQWFLDPVCTGRYPDDPGSPWAPFAASVDPADLAAICQPIDFIGMNLYNGTELDPANGYEPADKYAGYPRTSLKWPITPPVMYWGPRLVHERYGLPIIITENGQGCNDRIFLDGKVHDPDRIDFLQRYLGELSDAVQDGVPIAGYFHWSLTDNLEWHSGYDEHFGLVYIDYRSQDRILKDSALWYSDLIKKNL